MKKIIIIIVVVLLIGGGGFAGWYFWDDIAPLVGLKEEPIEVITKTPPRQPERPAERPDYPGGVPYDELAAPIDAARSLMEIIIEKGESGKADPADLVELLSNETAGLMGFLSSLGIGMSMAFNAESPPELKEIMKDFETIMKKYQDGKETPDFSQNGRDFLREILPIAKRFDEITGGESSLDFSMEENPDEFEYEEVNEKEVKIYHPDFEENHQIEYLTVKVEDGKWRLHMGGMENLKVSSDAADFKPEDSLSGAPDENADAEKIEEGVQEETADEKPAPREEIKPEDPARTAPQKPRPKPAAPKKEDPAPKRAVKEIDVSSEYTAAKRKYETGNVEEAKKMFENIIQNNPNDYNSLFMLGLIDYEEGSYETAKKYLYKVRDLSPDTQIQYWSRTLINYMK